MQEVSVTLTGWQLRRFFVNLLVNCAVSDPAMIWNLFREQLGDDYHGKDKEFRDRRSLFHIHKLLAYRKRTLADFGLETFISEDQLAEMEAFRPTVEEDTDLITSPDQVFFPR